MPKLSDRFRRWLGALLFVALAASVESWARWYCRERGDALERTSLLLEANASLGWRQRANFSGIFLGKPVHTNALGFRGPELSGATEPVVLVLGPSSAFGWGVSDAETYSSKLQSLLKSMDSSGVGKKSVVNAGEIGYSSFQGVRLSKSSEIARLRWRALVIGYGVNDVDHIRFYDASSRPDREEYSSDKGVFRTALLNGLTELHFLDLTRRRIQRWAFARACAPTSPPSVRVDAESYERNLRALAAEARSRGAPVVFLSTAFRYPKKPVRSADDERNARLLLDRARDAFREGYLDGAERAVRESLRLDPNVDEAWYLLSATTSRLGSCAESREAFRMGREREPFRLHRNLAEYNEIMRRVAESTQAGFLDVQALLAAEQSALLLDPIHPSARGHAMIANALADALRDRGAPR